ncbi:MAG: DUF3987 domain-containing protein [Planctomycetaceae bacterium]|nr:DUF3987 domain-containing protein [Planctomycetaceae bacterium]
MTPHLRHIGSRFRDFQKNGSGYKALCPLHDDTKPSLSINEGTKGGVVVRCMAGCPTDALLEVVGLKTRDLAAGAKFIVAEYDYRDEAGELLYQAIRMEPKEFRQRKPVDGGWVWTVKDTRKVLYRLPELLKEKRQRVLIVEGEKDVDRLRSLGFTATCNVGGAGKWLPGYTETLRGRHVAILPDNDPAGADHAEAVALALSGVAASVTIVTLPDLPPKGDVSDWLDAGGTADDLRTLISETPTQPPAPRVTEGEPRGCTPRSAKNATKNGSGTEGLDPGGTQENPGGNRGVNRGVRGVTPPASGPAPFPVEVFPTALQEFIASVAEALPCPADYIGAPMLGVLGTIIGRKRSIQIKDGWVEYPLLWLAVVGRSGDRKTPSFDKATEPLRKAQERMLAAYLAEKKAFEGLSLAQQKDTPQPVMKQIFTTDITVESLMVVLQANPNGIVFAADELAGFARGIGQYKGGAGADRQVYLSTWSGTQIIVNRKGSSEPIVVRKPFLSIVGGIQPDALSDLIDDSREDGFSARFCFAAPTPLPPAKWTDATVKQSKEYLQLCDYLFDLPAAKEPLKVSEAAMPYWVEWVNGHRSEEPDDKLRATWSKAEGYCLRLTLILHVTRQLLQETSSAEIDEASMQGGIALTEYFKNHATRVYSKLFTGTDRAAKALKWIKKQGGEATARLARMNGMCNVKSLEEVMDLFRDLEHHGHGEIINGKNNSVIFRLHKENQS